MGSVWAYIGVTRGVERMQPMAHRERIMIVDDDPSIRSTIALVLDDEGYDVIEARDGREALALLAPSEPGAIILDLNMPVMDGSTFYRELRARGLQTPVVILSAVNAVRVGQELGANAALNKPFDIDVLVSTVSRIVEPR